MRQTMRECSDFLFVFFFLRRQDLANSEVEESWREQKRIGETTARNNEQRRMKEQLKAGKKLAKDNGKKNRREPGKTGKEFVNYVWPILWNENLQILSL